jgi:hypothetical protein
MMEASAPEMKVKLKTPFIIIITPKTRSADVRGDKSP